MRKLILLMLMLMLPACTVDDIGELNEFRNEFNMVVELGENIFDMYDEELQYIEDTLTATEGEETVNPNVIRPTLDLAASSHTQALQTSATAVGQIPSAYTAYTDADEQALILRYQNARMTLVHAYATMSQFAQAHRALLEMEPEWRMDIIQTQVRPYLANNTAVEAQDSCYYSYTLSYNQQPTSLVFWTIIDLQSYFWFVNNSLVQPLEIAEPSIQQISDYLCAETSPFYDGLTVVKRDDVVQTEGSGLIGNYEFGFWAQTGEGIDACSRPIPEEQEAPEDSEWCWHQDPDNGDSTVIYRYYGGRYYYWGRHCYCSSVSTTSGYISNSSELLLI